MIFKVPYINRNNVKLGPINFGNLTFNFIKNDIISNIVDNNIPPFDNSIDLGDRRDIIDSWWLNFDGVNDYVEITDSPDFDITTNLSIFTIFNNSKSSLTQRESLISKFNFSANKREWVIYLDSNEKISIDFGSHIDGSLLATWVSDDVISTNSTNTIGISYSNSPLEFKVFLKGQEISGSFSLGSIPTQLNSTDSNIYLGASGIGATDLWDGQIGNTLIYNTTLTESNFIYLHRKFTYQNIHDLEEPNYSNCVLDINANESSGLNVFDASGNNNHGSLLNGVSWVTGSPYTEINETGYSKKMYGDDINDHVNLNSDIIISGDFVITYKTIKTVNNVTLSMMGFTSTDRIRWSSANQLRIHIGGISNIFPILTYINKTEVLNVQIERIGTEVTAIINGNSQTIDYGNSSDFKINQIYGDGNAEDYGGVIWDVNINNQAAYNGYGNTNADWIDQIGNNHGVVDGSPLPIYFSQNKSNITKDVLGDDLQYNGKSPMDAKLKNSNCGTLDGIDDYVDFGDSDLLSFGDGVIDSPFSFIAKIKVDNFTSNNPIFEKSIDNITDPEYSLIIDTSGLVVISLFNTVTNTGNNIRKKTVSSINTDVWYIIAATYDGSNLSSGINIYIDGILQEFTDTSSGTYISMNNRSGPLKMGAAFLNTVFESHFDGSLAMGHIYNRELNITEINSIILGEDITQGKIFDVNFSEGSGNIIYDRSSNNIHGNIIDTDLNLFWGTTQDFYHFNLQQSHNHYMYFDGVDDYVDFGKVNNTGNINFLDVEIKLSINDDGNYEPAFSRYGGATDIGWVIGKDNNNKAYAQVSNNGEVSGQISLSGTTSINDGNTHVLRVILINEIFTLYVDGVEEASGNFIGNIYETTANMRAGLTSNNYFKGIIYDIILRDDLDNIIFNTLGYGNIDKEWLDQNGSNNGTVNGSPDIIRIPSLKTDNIKDIFDNDIQFKGQSGNWINDSETIIDVENITVSDGIPSKIATVTKGYASFNGTSSIITTDIPWTNEGKLKITYEVTDSDCVVYYCSGPNNEGISITDGRTSGNQHVTLEYGPSTFTSLSKSGFKVGDIVTIEVEWDEPLETLTVLFNGESSDGINIGRHSSTDNINGQFGVNGDLLNYYSGNIISAIIYDSDKSTIVSNYNFNKDSLDISGNNNHGKSTDISFPIFTPDDSFTPSNPIMDLDGRNQVARLYNATASSDGVDDAIDTGVIPDGNTKIEIKTSVNMFDNGNKILGTRNIPPETQFYFLGVIDDGGYKFYSALGSSATLAYIDNFDTSIHTWVINPAGGEITKDNIQIVTFTPPTINVELPLHIYRENRISSIKNESMITVYYCKIWDNGVLIRHFVPYTHGGLLDLVENKLYFNQGTGTLVIECDRIDHALLFSTGQYDNFDKLIKYTNPI